MTETTVKSKVAFKGVVIESGNSYTIVYKDQTGMLRILQIYWEEGATKKEYQLDTVNLESEEIEDFINAVKEVM